jgi:hypothetical protein
MPLYQLIEKNENIAKRNFFEFACFLTGLIYLKPLFGALIFLQNLAILYHKIVSLCVIDFPF